MIIAIASGSPDYCDKELCKDYGPDSTGKWGTIYLPHTACNNPLSAKGKFGPECSNPTLVPITAELKKLFLTKHNEFRAYLANGKLAGFSSASNMNELVNYDDKI